MPLFAEFLRIPNRSDHPVPAVRGVVGQYNAGELRHIPLGAQVMNSGFTPERGFMPETPSP